MTAFEKLTAEMAFSRPQDFANAKRCYLEALAEAERLCRERALTEDASIACNCADAIAALREVDRG